MKRRSPGGGPVPGDVVIDRLEEHPNLPAILGVLAQLPHIADADLSRLAGAWRNTVSVAEARQRALSPDAPLVVEVLAVFEVISALFADDIAGGPNYIENDPTVTAVALHAVRDAVTAVHAQPILARWEYDALLTAWWSVYPRPTRIEPDLGPAGPDIKRLLETDSPAAAMARRGGRHSKAWLSPRSPLARTSTTTLSRRRFERRS